MRLVHKGYKNSTLLTLVMGILFPVASILTPVFNETKGSQHGTCRGTSRHCHTERGAVSRNTIRTAVQSIITTNGYILVIYHSLQPSVSLAAIAAWKALGAELRDRMASGPQPSRAPAPSGVSTTACLRARLQFKAFISDAVRE